MTHTQSAKLSRSKVNSHHSVAHMTKNSTSHSQSTISPHSAHHNTSLADISRVKRIQEYNHHLLSSEDQYVNELETLVLYIFEPLAKNAKRCKIGINSVKKVYAYLDSMLKFHLTFLGVIRETVSVLPDLYKYQSFVKMYADYLGAYDDIIYTFSTWSSMECREFLTLRLQQNEVKKHIDQRLCSLPWYLYRPFDRIKEYHRFLKDLCKLTHSTDDEYKMLIKTMDKFKVVYKRIKKNESRLQTKTRLLEIQLQIHGNPEPLVCDNRKFLYNKMCQMKRSLTWKKYKQVTIYLFTDLFLWVSVRGRFKGSYSFYKSNLVIEIPKSCKPGDAQFQIGLKSEKTKRMIVCADDQQRDKLMNYIKNAYNSCQLAFQSASSDTKLEIEARLLRENNSSTAYESSMNSSLADESAYEPSYSYSQQSGTSNVSDSSQNSNHTSGINGIHGGLGKISETEAIDEQKRRSIKHRPLLAKNSNITLSIIDAESVSQNTEIEANENLNISNETKLSLTESYSKSDAKEAFEIVPITPEQSVHATPTFDSHKFDFSFSGSQINKVDRKITPIDMNSLVSDIHLMKSNSLIIGTELTVEVSDVPRARSQSPPAHRLQLSPVSKSATYNTEIVSCMAKKAKEDRKHILKEKYERRINATKKQHKKKKKIISDDGNDDLIMIENKKIKRMLNRNNRQPSNRKTSSDALCSTSTFVQQLNAEILQLKEELKKEREHSQKKQNRIRVLESSNKSLRNTLSLLEKNMKLKKSNISGKKKILHCRPKSVASFTLGNGGLVTRSSFRIMKPHPYMSLPHDNDDGFVSYSDGRSSGLGIDLLGLKMDVLENATDDMLPTICISASRSINGSPKSNIKRPRLQSLQSF